MIDNAETTFERKTQMEHNDTETETLVDNHNYNHNHNQIQTDGHDNVNNIENGDYTLDYLLDRAFGSFNVDKEQFALVIPALVKKDRKAYITNFQDVCNSMKRDPENIRLFLGKELNMDTSVKENGSLKIDGTSKNLTIDVIAKFMKDYVLNYVQCKSCKSYKTTTQKVDRVMFLVCDTCKSKKSIAKH
jgi:translation initiation factor 2 subunit 2